MRMTTMILSPRSRVAGLFASLALHLAAAAPARAAGLNDLSKESPEAEADSDHEEGAEASTAVTNAAPVAPSELSKSLAQKLYLGTSLARVFKASRSKGNWKGSGASDVLVGYRVLNLGVGSVSASYRYAPTAVSGDQDGRSFRGVWETHYVGGRYHYAVTPTLSAFGSVEAGYVLVYLYPTDGLGDETKYEHNGGAMALGGGADWTFFEKSAFAVGPRLYIGFGSMTTVQLAAATTFTF
jgi:hypothetical protein